MLSHACPCRFGFTNTETVAIMGAHNLGRAHLMNSGFQGAWSLESDRLGSGECAVHACVLFGVCISGRGMRMGMGEQRLPGRVVVGERPTGQR